MSTHFIHIVSFFLLPPFHFNLCEKILVASSHSLERELLKQVIRRHILANESWAVQIGVEQRKCYLNIKFYEILGQFLSHIVIYFLLHLCQWSLNILPRQWPRYSQCYMLFVMVYSHTSQCYMLFVTLYSRVRTCMSVYYSHK